MPDSRWVENRMRGEGRDNLTDSMNHNEACTTCSHLGYQHQRTVNNVGGACKQNGCSCGRFRSRFE